MKSPRRKQEDRRADAETKLLDAAVELVVEKGYDKLTLADVGEAAGFSRGLPAHYFGSKDNLLALVAERIVASFTSRIEAREVNADAITAIAASLREIAQRTADRQVVSRALPIIIGASLVNPELAKTIKRLNDTGIDWLAAQLQRGVDEGLIRGSINVRAEAIAIGAFHRGCSAYRLVDPDFPILEATENFIRELTARLTRPAGRA